MSRQARDNLLLSLPKFKTELLTSYREIGFSAALLYSTQSISWYEFASYTIEELNGTFSKVNFHLNDFITIDDEDFNKSYAVIRGIFKHKGNDEKYYAFIVVNWFEDTNQEYSILSCPLYRLQTRNQWRRIFPISIIDNVQKVHFIHDCNSEGCRDRHHDDINRNWIKNSFYFTAI